MIRNRELNKESLLKQKREYYNNNKEKFKEYQNSKKDKIKEYNKEYFKEKNEIL